MSDEQRENINEIVKDLDALSEDIATINIHKNIIKKAILSLEEVENSHLRIEKRENINNKYVLKRMSVISYFARYASYYLDSELKKLEITITGEENRLKEKMDYYVK